MSGDHQTTLLISEEQRTNWEEYVGENPEFASKANLIRRAVEKETMKCAENFKESG